MTVSKRVAAFAAILSLCMATGIAKPSLAKGLSQQPLTAAALANISVNVPGFIAVPDQTMIDRQTAVDTAAQSYASLDEAVAAQNATAATDRDLTCLAGAIYYESKGEPLSGQLAVAEVILNRAHSGRFPTSICSVVTQPGQFSFVRGGRIPSIDNNREAYRTALAVAQVAMQDEWDSPVSNALYFHARQVSPGWGKTKVASIGNHVFYR